MLITVLIEIYESEPNCALKRGIHLEGVVDARRPVSLHTLLQKAKTLRGNFVWDLLPEAVKLNIVNKNSQNTSQYLPNTMAFSFRKGTTKTSVDVKLSKLSVSRVR